MYILLYAIGILSKWVSPISIRTKILVIVLAFVALLGVSFVFYSVFTTGNYKRLRLEGIEKTVEFETEKVNKKIAEIELGAIHFAISGLICREEQSAEVGELSVIEYLRDYPDAEGGGFWFEPYEYDIDIRRFGIYAFFDDAAGSFVLDETMYSEGMLDIDYYNYHEMSWYREIADVVTAPEQVEWTKPYIDDSGSFNLMITAGAGIFDDSGRLIGASNIDWRIEDVVNELTAIKPTANSFAVLCEPERNYIIINTDKKYAEVSYNAGIGLESLSWNIYDDTVLLDGTKYMSFKRVMDNGWLLALCIPESEIFEEAENQNERFSLIIAVLVAAMLCIIYLLLSALINRPLKRLTSEVSQLGIGRLDVNIEINTKDEVGLLAGAFNKMTADLKASIEQNARVMAEKERISTELDVAKKIQASMLPCIFPPFPDRSEFEIYASMQPAEEVGGDFYDFFFIDEDRLAVVIADVSDKGVPAALFMVIAKTLIKNNAQSGKSPKDVMETVNNILNENNEANMFVTAFLGYFHIQTGRLVFVNAGHNPPLLRTSGRFDLLKTKPGIMLAALEDVLYVQHEVTLRPGDGLYLYTDGVTEAVNSEDELFGESRLLETANYLPVLPLKEFTVAIQDEIDKFSEGVEQFDDITMLALSYFGGTPGMKEITVDARTENLDEVLDFVSGMLEGCTPMVQNQIGVAIDEAFSNISSYAYYPDTGTVTVRVSVGDEVTVEFEDGGVEYDPLSCADPDITLPAEEREVGGLGVFILKNIMDSIEYRRHGEKNILTIKKKIREL